MSGNNSPQRGTSHNPPAMNEKIMQQIVETQMLRVKNEAKELELRGKDMDHQSRYAEKLLVYQAEHLKTQPLEHRKTVTRLAWIVGLILIVVMVFIAYCLYLGKEDFILRLIQILGYFGTTWIGWYFGKKSKSPQKEDPSKGDDYQEVK